MAVGCTVLDGCCICAWLLTRDACLNLVIDISGACCQFISGACQSCCCRKKKGFTRTALRLMPYAAVVLLILLSIIAGFSMRRSSAKSRLLASTQAQLQTHTTELASIRVGAPASRILKTSADHTQPQKR